MSFTQQGAFSFQHVNQPDTPNVAASTIKTQWDSPINELKATFNALIVSLEKTTATSGADQIGSATITDLTGTNIRSQLISLIDRLKSNTDSLSGADFVHVTAITGVTGNTVQEILEALKVYVDSKDTSQTTALTTHKGSGDHDGRYYTETESDAKFEAITDLTTNRKLSATGDFTGSWFGITSPVASEPGIQSQVNANTSTLDKRGIDVTDARWGAKGDGLTNDTAAIQSAINTITNGGEVFFPAGTYLVTPPLVVTACTFRGAGNGKTIIKAVSNGIIFSATTINGLTFKDLTLDGNSTVLTSGGLVSITDSQNINFEDCTLLNAEQTAISITRGKNVKFENCDFNTSGLSGIRWNDPGASGVNENLWVMDCTFQNINTTRTTGNASVMVAFTTGVNKGLWIQNCRIHSNDIGIGLDTIDRAYIMNNVLEGEGLSGEGIAFTGRNVHISHNEIFNFGAAGILSWVMGTNEGNNHIEHNTCYDNNNGIEVVYAADTCVLSNVRYAFNRCFNTGTGKKAQSIGFHFYRKAGVALGSWNKIQAVFNDLRGNVSSAYNLPTDIRVGISFQFNAVSDTELYDQEYNLGVPSKAITRSGVFNTFTGEIAHQHVHNDEGSTNTGSYADYMVTFSNLRDRKIGGVRVKKADVFGNRVETMLLASSGSTPADVKEVGGALISGNFGTKTSAWDAAHFQMGSHHLWIDSSGRLRLKTFSAPTSDTDGVVVGTQT